MKRNKHLAHKDPACRAIQINGLAGRHKTKRHIGSDRQDDFGSFHTTSIRTMPLPQFSLSNLSYVPLRHIDLRQVGD